MAASDTTRPKCFSGPEWAAWKRAAVLSGLKRGSYYCTDCTPEFKAQMLGQNRCGWPKVTFHTRKAPGTTHAETVGRRFAAAAD